LTGPVVFIANHSSHLDTGLVKHALGDSGDHLVALAAKDYFFEDPLRRAYFENFTNLVPMERYGALRESLRLAGEVIRDGWILLIFPEGTRSCRVMTTSSRRWFPGAAQPMRHPAHVSGRQLRRHAQGYLPRPGRGRRPRRSVHLLRLVADPGDVARESYRTIAATSAGRPRLAPRVCLDLGDAGRAARPRSPFAGLPPDGRGKDEASREVLVTGGAAPSASGSPPAPSGRRRSGAGAGRMALDGLDVEVPWRRHTDASGQRWPCRVFLAGLVSRDPTTASG
jgi:hypothetical protein